MRNVLSMFIVTVYFFVVITELFDEDTFGTWIDTKQAFEFNSRNAYKHTNINISVH